MKNSEKLQVLGKENYKLYYEKLGVNENGKAEGGVLTVCMIKDADWFSRGISYCTPEDQFIRSLGRSIAIGRAIKAMENGESTEPIPEKVRYLPFEILHGSAYTSQFLSEFNVRPTDKEKDLFKIVSR
jgi:hypothetical protein